MHFAPVFPTHVQGMSGMEDGKNQWVTPVVVVGVLGILGVALYIHYKIATKVVEKEGAGGLLAYEAGMTGLGMLSRGARRNGKRKGRKSSRRRQK